MSTRGRLPPSEDSQSAIHQSLRRRDRLHHRTRPTNLKRLLLKDGDGARPHTAPLCGLAGLTVARALVAGANVTLH